jgi:ketosteroid isomerase-like protein
MIYKIKLLRKFGRQVALGEVRDELDIRNIVARIAHYSDTGGLDDYGRQFAEDACWEMPPAPPKRGRSEIKEAGAARRAEGLTGPGSQTRHVVTTVAVAVDGDAAVGRAPNHQRLSHQLLLHICRPPVTSSTVPVM